MISLRTFNKKLLILTILLIILLSFNVAAAKKSISGTKYKTRYDSQLSKVFKIVEEVKDPTTKKKTGEIRIADTYVIKDKSTKTKKTLEYTHGILAGDIRVKDGIFPGEIDIMIKKYKRKPGTYYNLDKGGNAQILKGDELKITLKDEIKDKRGIYQIKVRSEKNNVYFQEHILACKDCKINLDRKTRTVDVKDTAHLMTKETYKNKYKGKSANEISKLKPWELINIKQMAKIRFYKDKYKFSGNFQKNEGDLSFKLKALAYTSIFDFSEFGPLKISDGKEKDVRNKIPVTLGIIKPINDEYEDPIYLVKGTVLVIKDLPENILLHVDTDKVSNEKPHFFIRKSSKNVISGPGENMLAINKNTKKKGSSQIICPEFFQGYNCLTLDKAKQKVHFKPVSKDERILSPLSKNIEPSRIAFNFYLDKTRFLPNTYTFINIENIKDIGGYFNILYPLIVVGASEAIGALEAIKIFNSKLKMPVFIKWHMFDVSFSAKYPSPFKANQLDTIVCKHTEKKCYINGVEMSKVLKKGLQCKSKCYSGRYTFYGDCIDFQCYKAAECNELIPNSKNKPIRILFISHHFDENAIRQLANDMLKAPKGLFTVEPFKSNTDLFGAYYLTVKDFDLKQLLAEKDKYGFSGVIDKNIPKNLYRCPGYTHLVYLLPLKPGEKGRSYAYPSRSEAYVFIAETPFEYHRKTFVHEMGHSFGKFEDEYLKDAPKLEGYHPADNCISGKTKEESKKRALIVWTGSLRMAREGGSAEAKKLVDQAEREGWWGCGGDCDKNICGNYIRQAKNSIMNDEQKEPYDLGKIGKASLKTMLETYRSKARPKGGGR